MQKRGLLARKSQDLPPDHPELVALRIELKIDRAAEYIQKLTTENLLTDEQRTKLAELLKPVRISAADRAAGGGA